MGKDILDIRLNKRDLLKQSHLTAGMEVDGSGIGTGNARLLRLDEEANTLRVSMWVWDTVALEWVRMTQPGLNIDQANLNVSMGDVESLLAEGYWKQTRYAYDGSGNIEYLAVNSDIDELEGDSTWWVHKFGYTDGKLSKKEGPRAGSWTGHASLSWNF